MKRLINENIERAAEWLKVKKELDTKIHDHFKSCEHWIVKDSDSYKTSDNILIHQKCLICDYCGDVVRIFKDNSFKDVNDDFYQKQKKIFEYKYRNCS